MTPQPAIRRCSNGTIDIDHYRQRALAERATCRTALLARVHTTRAFLLVLALIAGPAAVGSLVRAASEQPLDRSVQLARGAH
jgi:hypothetical protein